MPWRAGVPSVVAAARGPSLLAVELIEGHGAGGEREPAAGTPGCRRCSRTGLWDGRAAGII